MKLNHSYIYRIIVLFSFLFMLVSCGGGGSSNVLGSSQNQWFHPSPTMTFQWQLTGNINPSRYADLYDIDLFDTNQSLIASLKQDNKKVICYFSAGSFENWRRDAGKYPKNIIGNYLQGWSGEQWVDIRSKQLKSILLNRIKLAQSKGCDGIEADNVDGYVNNTGFSFTRQDQIVFNQWLANTAHQYHLAVALKNAPNLVPDLVNDFDFSINESCYTFNECNSYSAFIQQGKPVYSIEYARKYRDNNNSARDLLCSLTQNLQFHTYILPPNLDDSYKIACNFDENLYNNAQLGFGGANSFRFIDDTNKSLYVNSYDLLFNTNFVNHIQYARIKKYNPTAFGNLQYYLKRSTFITLWATKNWQANWFDINSINNGISKGIIPIFIYWYFGDNLVNGMPTSHERYLYTQNYKKFRRFLDKIKGNKIVIIEPEFNKKNVLANANQFVSLISPAIDTIRSANTFVSLCMTDTGSRGVNQTYKKCGYQNCSLGDKFEWSKVKPIYSQLIHKLDFISFQEMLSPISRDPQSPGTWNNPNPKAWTENELGIKTLNLRVINMADYLYGLYHKPIFMPYIAIPTETWNDNNYNGKIEANEINATGFEQIASNAFKSFNQNIFLKHHLFGYGIMELFDNPQHDINGYKWALNNEFHLGIMKSSAIDIQDLGIFGDIQPKGNILISVFGK